MSIRRRSRRLKWFLGRTFLHVLWWDVVLNRPVLRLVRTDPDRRWRALALRFRALAVELGGVLIKLGQFLSTRADVLPPSITEPLSHLQDEVPAEPFEAIRAGIEASLGRPLDELFAAVDERAVGAASLAQAHAATGTDGRRVVLKVLRPDIETIVEIDLEAIGKGVRWLRLFGAIRRRVDLDRLADEFVRVTRDELDLRREGRNAERFAACFAERDEVLVPAVDWSLSGDRVLALEDVSGIKIDDRAALESAGIDPRAVARLVNALFLEQVFVHHFVHADPHPGNLFLHPGGGPGEPPFRIAYVDFGMMVPVPERLREALREYAIGLGTRDAVRIVAAYRQADVLLPGADVRRVEEVHEDLLRRFWGVPIGELQTAAFDQAGEMWREYRDLILDLPFQAPVDLLFVGRATGVTSGLATTLDPKFDPWAEIQPFAERLGRGALPDAGEVVRELFERARLLWGLPRRLDRFLDEAVRGRLRVEASLAPDARRAFDRLERAIGRLSALVLVVILCLVAREVSAPWGIWVWSLAAALALWSLVRR